MNYIILLLILMASLTVGADCQNSATETQVESAQTSSVDVPRDLKDAVITVKLKDNREYTFSANEYMVARRIKVDRIIEKNHNSVMLCSYPEKYKNEVIMGARQDYTGVSHEQRPGYAQVESHKALVIDGAYMRHNIFDTNLNLGVGIDTNATPKVLVGTDF